MLKELLHLLSFVNIMARIIGFFVNIVIIIKSHLMKLKQIIHLIVKVLIVIVLIVKVLIVKVLIVNILIVKVPMVKVLTVKVLFFQTEILCPIILPETLLCNHLILLANSNLTMSKLIS